MSCLMLSKGWNCVQPWPIPHVLAPLACSCLVIIKPLPVHFSINWITVAEERVAMSSYERRQGSPEHSHWTPCHQNPSVVSQLLHRLFRGFYTHFNADPGTVFQILILLGTIRSYFSVALTSITHCYLNTSL